MIVNFNINPIISILINANFFELVKPNKKCADLNKNLKKLESFFKDSVGSSPFFSPCVEIYGLVHVGGQPEHEICGEKKGLENTMGKKGT